MPLVYESILCTSFPKSTFTDGMLVAWIQLDQGYLNNEIIKWYWKIPPNFIVIKHLSEQHCLCSRTGIFTSQKNDFIEYFKDGKG